MWVSGRHITSVALHTLLNTVGLYNFLTPPERRGTALCGYLRTLGNAGGTTLTLLFVITLHDISTAHLPLYLLLYLSLRILVGLPPGLCCGCELRLGGGSTF